VLRDRDKTCAHLPGLAEGPEAVPRNGGEAATPERAAGLETIATRGFPSKLN